LYFSGSTPAIAAGDQVGFITVHNYATAALICSYTLATYNSNIQKINDMISLASTTYASNYFLVATNQGKLIEVSYTDCSLRRSWTYTTAVLRL
jgi:hypothetical protein